MEWTRYVHLSEIRPASGIGTRTLNDQVLGVRDWGRLKACSLLCSMGITVLSHVDCGAISSLIRRGKKSDGLRILSVDASVINRNSERLSSFSLVIQMGTLPQNFQVLFQKSVSVHQLLLVLSQRTQRQNIVQQDGFISNPMMPVLSLPRQQSDWKNDL